MARAFLRPLLALAALLLVWGAETGLGSCLGGSCAEQSASAKAQGLLGSTLGSLGICEPKKYPTTGSLVPVTLDTRITDVRWVNVTASGDVQHVYAITQDKGGFNGGPLWRTEDPGRADGWRDITSTLIGAGGRGVYVRALALIGTGRGGRVLSGDLLTFCARGAISCIVADT